jgi:hypothetical protein
MTLTPGVCLISEPRFLPIFLSILDALSIIIGRTIRGWLICSERASLGFDAIGTDAFASAALGCCQRRWTASSSDRDALASHQDIFSGSRPLLEARGCQSGAPVLSVTCHLERAFGAQTSERGGFGSMLLSKNVGSRCPKWLAGHLIFFDKRGSIACSIIVRHGSLVLSSRSSRTTACMAGATS